MRPVMNWQTDVAGRIGSAWVRFVRWLTPLRLGVALLALAGLIGALGYLNEQGGLYLGETLRRILAFVSANASTELVSLAFTLIIVDWLYQRRGTEREKKRLILQMGSPDNAFAREAVRALRSHGWLFDGSVNGASLSGANLQDAYLEVANLQGVYLVGANLQSALLVGAKYNDATRWPKGFTPPPEAVKVEE